MKLNTYLIYLVFFLMPGLTFSQNNIVGNSPSSILVLDGHLHHGFPSLDTSEIFSDMAYLKELGYNAIVHELPVDRSETDDLYGRIEQELEFLNKILGTNDYFKILEAPSEFLQVKEFDKIYCLFAIEHFRGPIFNNDISFVQKYKDLDIGYITIVNTEKDSLFIENQTKTELSDFGKRIIEKMNEVDLKIDISHLSNIDMLEVIKYSKAPVLASHSSSARVSQLEDNITDEVLNELKKTGGLVLLSFRQNRLFNNDIAAESGIEKFADHVDYLKSILGINGIGIGTDLQASGKYMAKGLSNDRTFESIKVCLIKRGYTHEDIKKIFYQNYIEFME